MSISVMMRRHCFFIAALGIGVLICLFAYEVQIS